MANIPVSFWVVTVAIGLILLVSIILMGISFHVVKFNTVAQLKGTITKDIDSSKIYKPGRYYTGIAKEFLDWPTTAEKIKFSDSSSANAGLIQGKTSTPSDIYIEASLIYKLRKEYIHNIYDKYPAKNYQKDYILICKSAVQSVAQSYVNEDFYTKRLDIEGDMAIAVHIALQNVYAELVSFQLLGILLPTNIETQIVEQKVKERNIQTATIRQQIQSIDGDITKVKSEADVGIKDWQMKAQTYVNSQRADIHAIIKKTRLDSLKDSYAKFIPAVFSDPKYLARFLFYKKLYDSDKLTMLVGYETVP